MYRSCLLGITVFSLFIRLPALVASPLSISDLDPPSNPPPPSKDSSRDILTGSSVAATGIGLIPTPFTVGFGIGYLIGEGASLVGIGIQDRYQSTPSRPDRASYTLPAMVSRLRSRLYPALVSFSPTSTPPSSLLD